MDTTFSHRSSEAKLPYNSCKPSRAPHSNRAGYDHKKLRGTHDTISAKPTSTCGAIKCASSCTPSVEKDESLRYVLLWGEGTEGGPLGGKLDVKSTSSDMKSDALLPKLVQTASVLDVKSISCGAKHAVLVTRKGEVYSWGEEMRGRLGHGVKMDVSTPKLVETLINVHVESIACGEHHTIALTGCGEFYAWGKASQIIEEDRRWENSWVPHRVAGPFEGLHITKVACGEWHSAVLSSGGQLFTYGDGTFGALGHGNLQSYSQPKEVESLRGLCVKSVACGSWHTAAIVDAMTNFSRTNEPGGKLFTWGDGDEGRLGHKNRMRRLVPTCVAALHDHDFVQVSCGRMLTVVLGITGVVYTMGSAAHGQLGGPLREDKTYVFVEGALRDEFVKQIASGSHHVAVLTSTGKVYTWGMGANGRLGLGDIEDRQAPTLVEALSERFVEDISCGSSFTAVICLHRSVSAINQSICTGCKMLFRFTRKRHNCYNCGKVFCHSCTSKKAFNAALAPNKKKQYRVCEPCFELLNKLVNNGLRLEAQSPRTPSVSLRFLTEMMGNQDGAGFSPLKMFSPRIPAHGMRKAIEKKISPDLPNMALRWGQVASPALFKRNGLAIPTAVSNPLRGESEIAETPSSINLKNNSIELGLILTEEVQRLQAEVERLTRTCQEKDEMLRQYRERIDETSKLAKLEAAKCKAAKDVIRVLACRINAIADEFSSIQEARNLVNSSMLERVDAHLPLGETLHEDSLEFDDLKSQFSGREDCHATDLKLFNKKLNHDVQTPSLVYKSDMTLQQMKLADDTLLTRSDCQSINNELKTERVEQDDPGVYVTLTVLPCGQKVLKRVRFSRRKFNEKKAVEWWKENQVRLLQKYNYEGNVSAITNVAAGF